MTVFPLFGPGSPEPGYITLDEALEQQSLVVTEVSEGGSVPELRVLNSGTRRVLLLDGEELLGAKQNRIINVSILVPVGKTLIIPVSCVERGRWHSSSARFSSSSRTYYARGRAMHTSQVSDSMRSSGSRRSDQASVWHDIETKSSRLRSVSATSAMAAMFEQYHAQIEEYVHAFQPQNDGIGALFCVQGRVRGLEFFDSPATRRKVMPKILRGYTLDALDTFMEAVPGVLGDPTWSEHAAQEFLEEIPCGQKTQPNCKWLKQRPLP